MNLENFGKHKIYRPSSKSEIENRVLFEEIFRKKYRIGVFTDKNKINEILQFVFQYYEEILKKELHKIASRDLMDFVLFQFDEAAKIEDEHKHYKLTNYESHRWKELGPNFRRTIKYIAESIVLLAPPELPTSSPEKLENILDKCWIACEEMVIMYGLSNQTFYVFPDKTILEILPYGNLELFTLKLTKNIDFQENIRIDTFNRTKILGDSKDFYQFNLDSHNEILKDSFTQSIGVDFKETLTLLLNIINNSRPDPNSFPILFVNKKNLINVAEKATSLSYATIEKVIAGFTITKSKMEDETRELYKPKQEYRAFRRDFFEFPHNSGVHLAFSKEMALECLFQLQFNIVFNQLPYEWTTNDVKKSLSEIVRQNGKWFESFVSTKLNKIGYNGITSIKKIKKSNKSIFIPSEVGEIDYIGFSKSEKSLLIAECKFVRPSFESTYFRDDLSEFIFNKKSYLTKYKKKVNWFKNNYEDVIEYFIEKNIIVGDNLPNRINTAIITFYPNIGEYFISEYPCVSLTKLIIDFKKDNKWSYSQGVFTI